VTSYYVGKRAQNYDLRWRSYTRNTLAKTIAMIDIAKLRNIASQFGRPPRVLDVACGTGVLLRMLAEQIPDMEGYGVDASADMLAQARIALKDQSHIQFEQAELGKDGITHLPYASQFFDLITCTNALHYMANPAGVIVELRRLQAPEGQMVVEDYARHGPPFLWALFEQLLRRIEKGQVRAFTLSEAESLFTQAGLSVVREQTFALDLVCHGWVLHLSNPACDVVQHSEVKDKK